MESDLPLEVLCQIVSHLDPFQRLSAGLVSKSWLQASGTLLEDVCLTIRGQIPTSMTGRTFPRVTFISTVIDDRCVDFLNRLGPQLLHLRFVDCPVRTEKKVDACLRLLSLWADCGDVLLVFSALPRLRDLDLRGASDLTDDTLAAFDAFAAPDLEVFAMPNATVYERLVCKRFYPSGKTLESHPSPYILSRAALETFVARRATTLVTLHLPEKIDQGAAMFLAQVDGLKLRGISFSGCCEENISQVLPEFCRHQPGIVALNVDNVKALRDLQVTHVCELLPALREFSARDCFRFLDCGVIPLLRLKSLRALCLAGCLGVTPVSFFVAAPRTPLLELRALDLSRTQIEDDHLHELLSFTPRLVELKLSGCKVSDATLADVICRRLTRLQTLELSNCAGVSDKGLRRIRNLAGLVRLDLRSCVRLTSAKVAKFIRFRHLREVDLRLCPRVTSSVIAPLRAHNPCLTELRVS